MYPWWAFGSSVSVVPITKAQLRAMTLRGNCGGQVLPGLGLSTHDALFDPMIPWYPKATQEAIFAAKKAAGLNVIGLCSWADYHGSEFGMPIRYDWTLNADGPQQARVYCTMLRQRGFIPIFWLLGDRIPGDDYDEDGEHCDRALNLIRSMLPAIKDVIGAAIPGFELRGCCGANGAPYSAAQYRRMLVLMNQIAPDLYKFGHFTSENSAGSSHSPVEDGDPWGGDEIQFWAKYVWSDGSSLLDGFFYQAPTGDKLFGPSEDWRDRWQECLDRIGPDKMWHVDVDCCWGESGWYDVTRGDHTEAQARTIAAKALAMGGKWSFSG